MKVKELIAELRQMDQDAEVHFAYNYGDHCRTTVAPVADSVDELGVIHSSYHDMYRLASDEEEEAGKDVRNVVVIQA